MESNIPELDWTPLDGSEAADQFGESTKSDDSYEEAEAGVPAAYSGSKDATLKLAREVAERILAPV